MQTATLSASDNDVPCPTTLPHTTHTNKASSCFGFFISSKPEVLEANTANLVEVIPADTLSRMVKVYPTIVCTRAEQVEGINLALTTALGVPREAVLALVVRHPGLLRAAPSTLTGAIATLACIPELGPAVALELTMQYPSVAGLDSNSISVMWQSLRHITAMRPEWRAEFMQWPGNIVRLANILILPLTSHRPLRYLAASQDCSKALVAFSGAYTWLNKDITLFDGLCPGYREWLSDQ